MTTEEQIALYRLLDSYPEDEPMNDPLPPWIENYILALWCIIGIALSYWMVRGLIWVVQEVAWFASNA